MTCKEFAVKELCVYSHLKEYLGREELKAAAPAMFATTRPPHVKASQDTLMRYVKVTIVEAGINTQEFTTYSCRHTTTRAVVRKQVPQATVLLAMGWSGEETFCRFYDQPVGTEHMVTNLKSEIWGQDAE